MINATKTCYYCEFYGQCTVEQVTCKDWTKYTGSKICNTVAYNDKWLKLHKRWYNRFNPAIQQQRIEKFNKGDNDDVK